MNLKYKHLILSLILLCFVQILADAQEPLKSSEWVRIESENKEISFTVPGDYSFVFDSEGFVQWNPRSLKDSAEFKKVRTVTAYGNGATVFFDSYDVKNAKKVLPFLLANHREMAASNISFENFTGLQIVNETDYFSTFYYLASEKNVYLIGFGSREKDNATVARFFNSVKLNGKSVFKLPASQAEEPAKTLSILDLQETPLRGEIMSKQEKKEMERKQKEEKAQRKNKDQTNEKDEKTEPAGDSKPLIILIKPRARYTEEARQANVQGKVVLV